MSNLFFATTAQKLKLFCESHAKVCVFAITLLVHGFVAVALTTGALSIPGSASDHLSYHDEAQQIARLLRSGNYTIGAVYEHHWYPLFVGVLYMIFGTHMIVGVTANALLAAGSAVVFFHILTLSRITQRKAFLISIIVLNTYASLVYQSSMLLKESWVLFLLLMIFMYTTGIIYGKKFTLLRFIIVLVLFVALRNLRFFIGLAAITGFFVAWFSAKNIVWKEKIRDGILMLMIVTGISIILSGKTGAFKSPTLVEYIKPEYVRKVREGYFKGGDTTTNIALVRIKEKDKKGENVSDVSVKAPPVYRFSFGGIVASLANALLGPFPWQLSLGRYVYAALDLLWWYPMLILSVIGIFTVPFRYSAPYIVGAGIIGAGVLIGADNLGALMRYRIPAFVILALFSITGFEVIRTRLTRRKQKV